MLTTVTTQVVLKLAQSCIEAEIATEVVAVAVAEMVKPDMVDVGHIGGLGDVDLVLFNELLQVIFVGYSPGLYGGASTMVKRPS